MADQQTVPFAPNSLAPKPAIQPAPAVAAAPNSPAPTPAPAVAAAPAAPEVNYTVPVPIPASLMGKLVSLSTENGTSISNLCLDLIQKAVNTQMLSSGTINDISEEAQDVFRTVSLEATLDALRIYKVPKSQITASDGNTDIILSEGDIVFNTTSDVKDLIAQIDEHRITKGLAPLENSICELLYHYGLTLGDYQICQEVTGMSYNKFVAVFKTLGLNEREQNGAQSNLIDTGRVFNKFSIIDEPYYDEDEDDEEEA